MGQYEHLTTKSDGPVATVYMNRPEAHNALDPALISALTRCFEDLAESERVRVVVLAGEGASFVPGADVG